MRVRAYQREQAWAPDYVAPDLSGTLQAARWHHAAAELLTAQADQETDDQRRAQLQQEAAESRALADLLDLQADKLERADEIRALWYAHTAETRAAAERARIELGARAVATDIAEDATTAEELLADQHAGQTDDDQHRELTGDHDLADIAEQRETDLRALQPTPPADTAETNPPDIREVTATAEPQRPVQDQNDWTRVPTTDQTANSITRAQRALAELEQRRHIEQRHAAEEARARQLTHWRQHDRAAAQANHRDDDRAMN